MVMMESRPLSARHLTVGASWWWNSSRRRDCSPLTPPRLSSSPSTPRCSRARFASSWRSGRWDRRWWQPPPPAPRPPLLPPPHLRLWTLSQPDGICDLQWKWGVLGWIGIYFSIKLHLWSFEEGGSIIEIDKQNLFEFQENQQNKYWDREYLE